MMLAAIIFFTLIVGFNLGFLANQAWVTKKLLSGMAALNVRLAVISRRLGSWIQRQPTEKQPAEKETAVVDVTDSEEVRNTLRNDEPPTKKE